ncbi:MAG: MFS transporter [Elusimicrobiota bacterium]
MTGFVEGYIVPFALLLRAGGMEIGLLRSLPALVGALTQVRAADIVNFVGSRKAVVTACALVQVVCLLLMAGCVFLERDAALWTFVLLVVLFTTAGTLSGPPWTSMMGEYLPPSKRGEFLGWRSRLVGISLTGFSLLGGFILAFSGDGRGRGFALLFLAAAGARLASWMQLRRMHEPSRSASPQEGFSFYRFLRKTPSSNFARFTLTCALLMFGTHLSSPFFAPYMIEQLGLGYIKYTVVISAGTFALYTSMSRWGRWADYLGGISVVRSGMVMIPLIPLLWCATANPIWLAFFEVFSGFAWAAYGMGTGTFLYDAVSPEKRTRCAAYFAATIGLAQCLGAVTGGWLYENLPAVGGSSFYPLLVLSAAGRLAAALVFIYSVSEVRPVPRPRRRHLMLAIIGFRPLFYR